jgi:hypothetical protein
MFDMIATMFETHPVWCVVILTMALGAGSK